MEKGGELDFLDIAWFNGGLFDDAPALALTGNDLDDLYKAAKRDWSQIDPAILGTLFERGLDPGKRSQLGAHYTDRAKIMLIVQPVVIDPLEAEWTEVRARIEEAMAKVAEAKARRPTHQKDARKVYLAARRAEEAAYLEAQRLRNAFLVRLKEYRVLDPACGSGNFLYVALRDRKSVV